MITNTVKIQKELVDFSIRLQITTGPYRTKHGQAICKDLIEEFTHIKYV